MHLRAPRLLPLAPVVAAAVAAAVVTAVLAQGGPPPPGVSPDSVGVAGASLGALDPQAAPGHRLEVVELTWEPGAYAARHSHPTALITCVQEGALGFRLDAGAAFLVRGGTAGAPGEPEALTPGVEVVLAPRDCITFDEFSTHMEHTGWNASDGTTMLWETRLLDPSQPFTTYVDEAATPAP